MRGLGRGVLVRVGREGLRVDCTERLLGCGATLGVRGAGRGVARCTGRGVARCTGRGALRWVVRGLVRARLSGPARWAVALLSSRPSAKQKKIVVSRRGFM